MKRKFLHRKVKAAALCGLAALLLAGCGGAALAATEEHNWQGMQPIGQMELRHAEQFTVEYYEGGLSLISVGDGNRYLMVPEGGELPAGLDEDITVLQQPLAPIYLAASSAMDLFAGLDALDVIAMTSTAAGSWSLPEIREKVAAEDILYVGKYSAPDYEVVLDEGCALAIESTMIYHKPEVKEQLERLGVPVLVERSSYETDPLGRMEWMKLYGLLTGKNDEAERYFDDACAKIETLAAEDTGKTVAFFYINTAGAAVVHKPGNYLSKMIDMAGGHYAFADLEGQEENALSTATLQMEAFYAVARDADVLIYNSSIDGELKNIQEFLDKSAPLADCKAVKEGNVWCTGQDMFQKTTGVAEMVADIHAVCAGTAENTELTYLHQLK